MKKRSAKASCQRADRAFAEFEALTRNLPKASQSKLDAAAEELRQRIPDQAGDDPPMRRGRPRA